MRRFVLTPWVLVFAINASVAKSEMIIGSNPVFVPIAKRMAKSSQDFECIFEFLRAGRFSLDPSCEESNSSVKKIFEMKGLDVNDLSTIKRVSRDLTAMLLRLSGIRP